MNNFEKLAAIDVSDHIEKKNGLSYLSWPWAVDQIMRADGEANWTWNEPQSFPDGTMMVSCTVTAFGKSITMHLPVMDYRNKAIQNPDAFAINTAQMRCLVKAIACHGLGLYIYAGEDLPSEGSYEDYMKATKQKLQDAAYSGSKALKLAFSTLPNTEHKNRFWLEEGEALKAIAEGIDNG